MAFLAYMHLVRVGLVWFGLGFCSVFRQVNNKMRTHLKPKEQVLRPWGNKRTILPLERLVPFCTCVSISVCCAHLFNGAHFLFFIYLLFTFIAFMSYVPCTVGRLIRLKELDLALTFTVGLKFFWDKKPLKIKCLTWNLLIGPFQSSAHFLSYAHQCLCFRTHFMCVFLCVFFVQSAIKRISSTDPTDY